MDGKTEKGEKNRKQKLFHIDNLQFQTHSGYILLWKSIYFFWCQSVLKAFVNQSFLSPDASLQKKKSFCKILSILYNILFQFNVSTIYTTVATELKAVA